MRTGAIISAMLHFAVLATLIFGLPSLVEPIIIDEQPVLVELVDIAESTTPQQAPAPEPEAKPEPEPDPKPAPVEEQQQAAAPPPPPPPPPQEEKVAALPKPEPAVVAPPPPKPEAEKPVEAPKPKPKPEAEETPPVNVFKAVPRPRAKPAPPQQKPSFDAGRIAALLDKSRKKPADNPGRANAVKSTSTPLAGIAATAQAPLTMSEIDAIRFQIQQCWSVPAGARDAENLVVRIRVFLNPDGSLARAPEIVDGGSPGNTFYRTAAESARRAVLKCSPLKNLPVDKYQRWREITLTFNPRDMLGG